MTCAGEPVLRQFFETCNQRWSGFEPNVPSKLYWPRNPTQTLKSKLFPFALASILSGTLCVGQTNNPADDWKPSTLNQPGQEYPQVNSQRYARFRIVAPQAQSVRVSLGLGGRGGTALDQRRRRRLDGHHGRTAG